MMVLVLLLLLVSVGISSYGRIGRFHVVSSRSWLDWIMQSNSSKPKDLFRLEPSIFPTFLYSLQSMLRFRFAQKWMFYLPLLLIVLCSLSAECTHSWESQSLNGSEHDQSNSTIDALAKIKVSKIRLNTFFLQRLGCFRGGHHCSSIIRAWVVRGWHQVR